MMDLVKEERERRDKEETRKMMDAIHKQAYWRNKEEQNKRTMALLDKELNKKKKSKIKEALKRELATALLMIYSLATLTVWGLVFFLMKTI